MLNCFVDPLFRAPFLGSMLMCFASALMGTYLFVRRRTLLGEALSHAAYPGVVLSLLVGSLFLLSSDDSLILVVLTGAFLFSFLGMISIEILHFKYRTHLDAAMCLVLSIFLGLGVVIASQMQFSRPIWYQQAQFFIYGQAATMTDHHIIIYSAFSLCITLFMILRFRQVEILAFDRTFAQSLGINLQRTDFILMTFTILAIVVGIRSVGVMMMSGMLIAPVVAARAFTNHLSHTMALSAVFGLLSGFAGNYLSMRWSSKNLSFPTGAMILLFSVALGLLSLLVAPRRGAIARFIRAVRFRKRCYAENILKALWKNGIKSPMSYRDLRHWNPTCNVSLRIVLFFLKKGGWIKSVLGGFLLTSDGVRRASHLVRLHRLWELYLVTCLDIDEKRVHHSAEEMEHIITPEIEKILTDLLDNPQRDPHHRPIPKR